ncbi:TPA: hypothetical protein ACW7J1_004287 [Citrobacter freundii]|nr:hypothetical protein [Salmonella enterica subsp. enterica serovar Havana]
MEEENKIITDHAWRYFELHSQQRMTVFNFYIAIIGLLAAGCGVCIQIGGNLIYLTSLIGAFIIFITFIFHKLDQRVSFLIKNAESILVKFETKYCDSNSSIFIRADSVKALNNNILSMWTYGKCFRVSFYIIANIGLIIAMIPLYSNLINI